MMSVMTAAAIMLIVDLDRPARGLINVAIQPVVEAVQDIPP
jgi:hypothetical protein